MVETLRYMAGADADEIVRVLPSRVVGLPQTFVERLAGARPIYSRNGLATAQGVETVSRHLWAVVPRKERPPKPETLLEMRFILDRIP
jgi:hypothetical protein